MLKEKKKQKKKIQYTHRDKDGMLWRWEGGRPVSKLADCVVAGVNWSGKIQTGITAKTRSGLDLYFYTDRQDMVENCMTLMGYGCRDYTLGIFKGREMPMDRYERMDKRRAKCRKK